jgi:hypothetical protein
LDIAMHLRDQLLDAAESLLAAQPRDELNGQPLAVQVALEVEHVGLDQRVQGGTERRPHADVHSCQVLTDAAGVNPVSRTREFRVGNQVGGREAELTAALVAGYDLAADPEARSQQSRCRVDLTIGQQVADSR